MKHAAKTVEPARDPLTSGRTFNDDLLANPGDLKYAENQFPEIIHLLNHPELRDAFARYDRVANVSRRWVRRLGSLAIAFSAIALLSAVTRSYWQHLQFAEIGSMVFELCGLVAACIAAGSLWLGPWRKRWLESRFMTERIRQWYFQSLVHRSGEIEAMFSQGTASACETFVAKRKRWFADFIYEHEGKLDSRMDSFAHDPDFSSDWLHQRPTMLLAASPAWAQVFEAYRRLRFLHQYDYATHNLSESREHPFWAFLKWPLVRQESAIRWIVSGSFGISLVCSGWVILNHFLGFASEGDQYAVSAVLALTIIGVAFRTLEEGLGITNDIERYRDYRGKIRRLLLHFEATADNSAKFRLMEEMELLIVDELRGFLRTHRAADFVL